MKALIRRMTEADRLAVKEMMRVFYASEAVHTNGSEAIFERDITACIGDSPFADGYVFTVNGKTVGYGMTAKSFSTEFGKPCVWIEDIYIRPEHRGEGIGTAFIDHLKKLHTDALIRLEVEDDNTAAVKAYRKNGFSELPYKEMYYNNNSQ